MRCKKHPSDLSSTLGVCASCLRERLFALIAAQAQAQAQAQTQAQILRGHHSNSAAGGGGPGDPRKSDPNPPPLVFPRSVSPYVSRRKSEESTWNNLGAPENQHPNRHLRFYSTPQVGPTFAATSTAGSRKKKPSKFSLWSNLFRSRSEKFESDPRVHNRDSYAASSSSSPSWFTAIFTGRRDKQSRQFYPDDTIGSRKPRRRMDRGMSPVRDAEYDYDYDGDRSPSGSGNSTESSPSWKRTPTMAPPSARRSRPGNGRNVSGLAFCLSPLVRASPNRHWNQKTLPPEMGMAGEARVSMKPHIAAAASYCANRSRKLADFGRANHNR